MKYRADIDGLRALAVLAVLAFHAFPAKVRGGFAGVDVFFVISGFLITGILLRGELGIVEFYARRVRRIFPALCLVLLATLGVGWAVLFSDEYGQLGRHTAAGAGFVSNLLLLKEVSYFDPVAESKPLLHLWSLGVEEQFYLVLPLLLVVTTRLRVRPWLALGVFALLSFAANLALVRSMPSATYYLPVTRFWELLAGGLLACLASRPAPRELQPREANLLSAAGLLLLVASMLLLRKEMRYPGHYGLFPVVGTVLVIAAGPQAWLNRVLLASRPAVAIGKISYPLYLWHWPLLSLAFVYEAGETSTQLRLALLGLSVVLAAATYLLVERPTQARPARRVAPAWALACVVAGTVGVAIAWSGGVPSRPMAKAGQVIADARRDWTYTPTTFEDGRIVGAHVLPGRTPRQVVVFGSSFMGQYWARAEAIYAAEPKPLLTMVFAARNHCTPMPGDPMVSDHGVRCSDYYAAALAMAQRPEVDTVVLGGRWPRFTYREWQEPARRFAADLRGLVAAGKRVVLVGTPPSHRYLDPFNIARQVRGGFAAAGDRSIPRAEVQDVSMLQNVLDLARQAPGVEVVDPTAFICPHEACPVLLDGRPTFSDEHHIRASYARRVATFLDDIADRRPLPPPSLARP